MPLGRPDLGYSVSWRLKGLRNCLIISSPPWKLTTTVSSMRMTSGETLDAHADQLLEALLDRREERIE